MGDLPPLVLVVGGTRRELATDRVLTFGRSSSCDVVLDGSDTGISRTAGSVSHDAGTWWLANLSTARPLGVVDDLGLRSILPAGRRLAVESPLTVTVTGSRREHALSLRPPPAAVGPGQETASGGGLPTRIGEEVLVSAADKLALVALFAGYLEDPPRHDPNPRSYAAAASRLGWPRTTLVKRVEHLRTRLTSAGVPGLSGWTALWALAEWALTSGVVAKPDLALLPGRD